MKQCFEKTLIEQCAPTLAGVKPASLFRIKGDLQELRCTVDSWDSRLKPFGIRVMILKECLTAGACMVYIYRKRWLGRILHDTENLTFLKGLGYQGTDPEEMLLRLSRQFCLEGEYPHEIGLFLGYPLEDVVGFIKNRGHNFTCCGHWKCYGDPAAAQARFDRYNACTSAYKRLYGQGTPVIQLVVAA